MPFVLCLANGWTGAWYPIDRLYHEYFIPTLDQVMLLGSVGYIDPLTQKFVFLFNAMDPASSTEPRIQRILSILMKGVAEVLEHPGYSPPWDYAYNKFDILHKLDAWTRERSFVFFVPNIYALLTEVIGTLCLAFWRASRRVLEDNQIEKRSTERRQTITDVFEDDHSYIRKRLDVVTTTVDSSQYEWFAHLGNELYAEDSSSEEVNTILTLPIVLPLAILTVLLALDPQALVTNDYQDSLSFYHVNVFRERKSIRGP
ncbi:hypothetical protein F5146DRAFT_1155599 [Armillaria mellea]|nr:hypothetical protein F5146DRAFT_1155599 [Armillaria mellea]